MIKILLRVLVSLGFIALLFYVMRDDIPRIAHSLSHTNPTLLAGATGLFLFSMGLMGYRLAVIFSVKGLPVGTIEAVNLTLVGCFFNNFLPTSVGGDVVKAMCAARVTKNTVSSVTAVLMDRIFGLFTFIFIPSITLIFYMKKIGNPVVPVVVYSLLVFSTFCFFMIFNRGLARKFHFVEHWLGHVGLAKKARQIYDGMHQFKSHPRIIVLALSLSIAGQAFNVLVLYLIALALGASAPVIYFFLLVPVVHLASMLPISFGGLGLRESAYIFFLAPVIGREYAAALSILWLGLVLLSSFLGGLIYMARHDYHFRWKGVSPVATP